MTGLIMALAVIAAVAAVAWRRFSDRRAAGREPGATIALPIVVSGFDEIDANLQLRECDCGGALRVSGETSRETKQRRLRIVRLVCAECDHEHVVHFDVTAVFH